MITFQKINKAQLVIRFKDAHSYDAGLKYNSVTVFISPLCENKKHHKSNVMSQ